jgi:pantothenate synthetase
VEILREAAQTVLRSEPKLTTEYVSLSSCADGAELTAMPPPGAANELGTMAAVAVKLGSTRLIDNIVL